MVLEVFVVHESCQSLEHSVLVLENQGNKNTYFYPKVKKKIHLVELCSLENGIQFRRLDARMSLTAGRDRAAVKEFSNDPDVSDMNILDIFSSSLNFHSMFE